MSNTLDNLSAKQTCFFILRCRCVCHQHMMHKKRWMVSDTDSAFKLIFHHLLQRKLHYYLSSPTVWGWFVKSTLWFYECVLYIISFSLIFSRTPLSSQRQHHWDLQSPRGATLDSTSERTGEALHHQFAVSKRSRSDQ